MKDRPSESILSCMAASITYGRHLGGGRVKGKKEKGKKKERKGARAGRGCRQPIASPSGCKQEGGGGKEEVEVRPSFAMLPA